MEKRILIKIHQTGSMMIEALAMLALVSLVTPTLYKKAAERTMELQDINSATQIRALIKAADSYTAANFDILVKEFEDGESLVSGEAVPKNKTKTISAENLRAYLPEGYQLNSIKNFGTPQAAVKLGGTKDHETLTSYVVLPQQGTLNSVRSARIASMVGANGGIVDEDGNKKILDGVSNIWKLDGDNFKNIFGNGETIQKYSVGAISEHAIDVGNSTSLENPKYLQRTLDPGEEWRNTMETTLYMGGPTNMDGKGIQYNNIEGVNRLIIGDDDWNGNSGGTRRLEHDEGESLIIANHNQNDRNGTNQKGSAWIQDSLTALYDKFSVTGDKTNPELNFDEGLISAKTVMENDQTSKTFSITTDNAQKTDLIIDKQGALLNVATKVDNTLETTGKTSLANGGIIITPAKEGETSADSSTKIYTKTTTVYGESPVTGAAKIESDGGKNIIFDVQGSSYVSTALEVGNDVDGNTNLYTKADSPILLNEKDRELNVVGDAFVSDTLETGFLAAHDFDALDLHAGGRDYDTYENTDENMGKYKRWLNATKNGVFVKDLDDSGTRDLRMQITDNWVDDKGKEHTGITELYGPKTPIYNGQNEITGYQKGSALQLGQTAAQLYGTETTLIYSADATQSGTVNIQNGAIVASGQAGIGNLDNTIDMHAQEVKISGSKKGSNTGLTVTPDDYNRSDNYKINSSIVSNVERFIVNDKTGQKYSGAQRALAKIESLEKTTIDRSGPDRLPPVLGVNQKDVSVWGPVSQTPQRILQVDASSDTLEKDGKFDRESSVYIRRGAIELEHFNDEKEKYAADQGLGYVEASRFVANNVGEDGNILSPTGAYTDEERSLDTAYDRYMVNPAYTSVMHDIKLTTRGGARLSEILPDFINKGIYLVTNTYKEGSTPANLISVDENGQFASPYLGYVPAPICPQGYAKVITLTPASFQMAQAGTLSRNKGGRFYVTESNPVEGGNKLYDIIEKNLLQNEQSITGAKLEEKNVLISQERPSQTMWYLGYDNGPEDRGPTYGIGENSVQYAPTPLYFQQSTWLKAATPSYSGNSICSPSDVGCRADRWLTIIGFLYPKGTYGALADALQKADNEDAKVDKKTTEKGEEFYWNLFPVGADTIEAYATVYCYFDRTNIFGSNRGDEYRKFIKQYDMQPDDEGYLPHYDNGDYIERLNDPHLKYEDPL